MRQFAHRPELQSSPLGRWYLKLRLSSLTPPACNAEAIVSPSKAETRLPLKVNETLRFLSSACES